MPIVRRIRLSKIYELVLEAILGNSIDIYYSTHVIRLPPNHDIVISSKHKLQIMKLEI
jgi:hypothetical protein